MPTKRANKTKVAPKARAQAAKKKPALPAKESSSIGHDVAGVLLILIAFVLALSLFVPELGAVSEACNATLQLWFGIGAILIPLVIAILGVSFFVPQTKGVSLRSAIGLGLAATAVLAVISLAGSHSYILKISETFTFLTSTVWAPTHGGIWGGLVAALIAYLFGEPIGMVVLLGIFIVALLLCGFSISALVEKVALLHAEKKEEEDDFDAPLSGEHTHFFDRIPKSKKKQRKAQNADMPFLGSRKTSVISRETAPTAHLKPIETIEPDQYPAPKVHPPLEEVEVVTESEEVPYQPNEETKKLKKRKKTPEKPKEQDVRPGNASDILELPPMNLLSSNPGSAVGAISETELQKTAARLQATLEEFGLKSKVRSWVSGPLVTTFKIEMGEGERVNKITNLEDDISLSLASSSVRIYAPIPGTSLVGIEIPNKKRNNVCLGDVLPDAKGGPLEIAVGRDSEGSPVLMDLATLPHLLVAGTTGSGKSVMLNAAIMSILMRSTPDQVRLILIDPKRVEFTGYAGLPHLYVPVVNEPQQAASSLQWAAAEMMRRLKLFEKAGARDIKAYNKLVAAHKLHDDEGNEVEKEPYFVIVIDELADLMMVAGKEVEGSIVRLAQLGRAAGIHLIVATQRPSADVVTGLIKANIDNRVALSVDNGTNSRIIIDHMGAEKLLGNGDMLVKLRGDKLRRVQGCYVSDPEIASAVHFINEQSEPEYHDEILSLVVPAQMSYKSSSGEYAGDEDPLLWEAAHVIVDSQIGSTSGLQRRLKVGYARAGRIMDMLEEKGIVGPPDGSKPREVLLSAEELSELEAADKEYKEV